MPELNHAAAKAQDIPACAVDHSRPETITLDCPVTCLDTVLSANAFCPLYRARHDRDHPVRTAGDVVALHQQGHLWEIRGLGVRRIGEIAHWLNYTGLLERAGSPANANAVGGG